MCLWFPNWPVQRFLHAHPQHEGRCLLLYGSGGSIPAKAGTTNGRAGRVLAACSDEAALCGAKPNMTLAEATALVGDPEALWIEPHDPQADRTAMEKLARVCHRFSPTVSLAGEMLDALLLDISGLGHLFGGEEVLARQALDAISQAGFTARSSVADSFAAAWALARYSVRRGFDDRRGSPDPAVILTEGLPNDPGDLRSSGVARSGDRPQLILVPPSMTAQAVGPLPVESLGISAEVATRLRTLGLVTVGQLRTLPRKELAARFGGELLRQLDRLYAEQSEALTAEPATEAWRACWNFEVPTENADVVRHILDKLLSDLATRLTRQSLGALGLECRFASLGVQPLRVVVNLFRPGASSRHWSELVQLNLERASLPGPLSSIYVAATSVAPLDLRQQELFATGRFAGEGSPQVAALVERLTSRLGVKAVSKAQLEPEAQPELACHFEPLVGAQKKRAARRKSKVVAGLPTVPQALTAGLQNRPGDLRSTLRRGQETCAEQNEVARSGDRPQHTLSRPLRIIQPRKIDVISVVPDGPPVQFQWRARQYRIARTWGPERIETGWWRGQMVWRDYYRVETEEGQWAWLFRGREDGKWFLQGWFD